jgi:hypothetical protein
MSLTKASNEARYKRLLKHLHRTTGKYRELFMPVQLEDGSFISMETLERIPSEPVKKKLKSPGVHGLVVRVSSKVVEAEREKRAEMERLKEIQERHANIYPR